MPGPKNNATMATAKVIPVFLTLVVAYVSYVVVGPLSVNYLFNPPDGVQPRVEVGIAVSLVWFILVIPVAACWIRLLVVVAVTDQGFMPLGDPKWTEMPVTERPGIEDFFSTDVFVCDYRGLPKWCDRCHNWKPDRAHHGQDAGRCSLKMDHFCPWVGGVVGERAYKFFVQFLVYSLVLSSYGMILLAYFVSETRDNVQWIVALGLAAFFVFFTSGMAVNSIWMAMRNVTSIEGIDVRSRTKTGRSIFLAVLLPPELQGMDAISPPPPAKTSPLASGQESQDRPLTSELDDPSHASYFSQDRASKRARKSQHWKGTITYPFGPRTDRPPLPAPEARTYAILETVPGSNPWDLGTPYHNLAEVFGSKLHDWVLPLRHSPCCEHTSRVSRYPLGPEFEQLLEDSGIIQSRADVAAWEESTVSGTRSEKIRRKRRLPPGWENGERPPGWVSAKEASRQKHEERRRHREEKRDDSGMS